MCVPAPPVPEEVEGDATLSRYQGSGLPEEGIYGLGGFLQGEEENGALSECASCSKVKEFTRFSYSVTHQQTCFL